MLTAALISVLDEYIDSTDLPPAVLNILKNKIEPYYSGFLYALAPNLNELLRKTLPLSLYSRILSDATDFPNLIEEIKEVNFIIKGKKKPGDEFLSLFDDLIVLDLWNIPSEWVLFQNG